MHPVCKTRLQCLAHGVDGVGRVLPLGSEYVAEVGVDVEEEFVQEVSGRFRQQILFENGMFKS